MSKGKKNIYPNPTNSVINIDFINSNYLIKSTFKLFDLTGKSIFTQQLTASATQIDVSKYPEGIYFYHITNKDGQSTGKIVIQ